MHSEVNKIRLTVLIALLFSALCAGVFRTPPIVFMAALLVSAPVIGVVIGSFVSRGLQLRRVLPTCGTVGDVIAGELILKNSARWPAFLVHVRSGFDAVYEKGHEPNELPAIEPSGEDEQIVPVLKRGQEIRLRPEWLLRRRGIYRLSAARAGVLDPLGLYTRLSIKSSEETITVLPRLLKIDQLGLIGGVGNSSNSPRHATIVADALEMHGVRPWQPGEAIRRAHWKYTARTGKLHVIEWEETPSSDLAILLDTSGAAIGQSGEESTLESAITAAASIAVYLLESGCRVQIFYFGQSEETITNDRRGESRGGQSTPSLQRVQARSVGQTGLVLRSLAAVQPVTQPDIFLTRLVEEAKPQMARGIGSLILASSRANVDESLARLGEDSQAVIFDADSYERSQSEASSELSTPSRSSQRASQKFRIHASDSLGAALEGHLQRKR